jgi:hypothetical protein
MRLLNILNFILRQHLAGRLTIRDWRQLFHCLNFQVGINIIKICRLLRHLQFDGSLIKADRCLLVLCRTLAVVQSCGTLIACITHTIYFAMTFYRLRRVFRYPANAELADGSSTAILRAGKDYTALSELHRQAREREWS